MADETTRTGEETSWWDLDVFADSDLPSTSFDEPLVWPETLDWGEYSAADGDLRFPGTDDLPSDPIVPPASDPAPPPPPSDTQWQGAAGGDDATMPHVTVLSGLGGGASPVPASVAGPADHTEHERLPDSLWAGDNGGGNGVTPVVTTTMATPTFYSQPESRPGGWRRRFDIRHGNAAVIALISFVSLILLGMFMSVRARNQLPDTSHTRTTSDQIQVQGPLNTVPLTTTVTTTVPAINIADLVPPPEDATTVTAGGAAGSGGSSAPATTAAPRSTSAGGGTGTTQPAAQSTNTTAAPATTAPPETTVPPVTSPPVNQTTPSTTPRRTTPTFWSTTVPDNDSPSFPTIPSIPGFPGFNS